MKKEDSVTLVTTIESAAILGVTCESVRNYRRRGWLDHIRRPNGRILFVRQQVEKLREELIANRARADRPEVVEASLSRQARQSWRKQSLRNDRDRLIFAPSVWKALAEYEAARQER